LRIPAPSELKQGSMTIQGGVLFQKIGEHLEEVRVTAKLRNVIKDVLGVRDALNNLLYLETENAEKAPAARAELGKVYDAFVKKHGAVHKRENIKAFGDDPDRYRVLALEKDYNPKTGKATKADIFTTPTRTPYERPTTAAGIDDAVSISRNE